MSRRVADAPGLIPLVLALMALLSPAPARAADTVEHYARGVTNLDLYLGFDGVGPSEEKAAYGEIMLGIGLMDRLSAFTGVVLQGDQTFSNGAGELYLGLMGTPLETDHLDLDLFLELRLSGESLSQFQATPSMELNVDADPQMGSWGLYLRAGLPLYGREVSGGSELALQVETTLGAYLTLGKRHQVLLEYDMGFSPRPEADQHQAEVGGVALGYNLTLSDAAELISQVYLDLPQQGNESWAVNFMLGVIITMPGH